jgi:uncharacterized delta-60 repeat protein
MVGGNYPAVHALAVQADGSVLLGGSFSVVGVQPRMNLARLDPDGALDSHFDTGANDMVNALAVQADAKMLVGGAFTQLGGQARSGIARLNADGTLDSGFFAAVGGSGFATVYSLALQPDGKIVVGG